MYFHFLYLHALSIPVRMQVHGATDQPLCSAAGTSHLTQQTLSPIGLKTIQLTITIVQLPQTVFRKMGLQKEDGK